MQAASHHGIPNHATLVRVNNPFAPYRDREIRHLACAGPIRAVAPRTSRPFIIQRNGLSVLRRDWDQPIERGDVITVVILTQGGGGGGSNPLKIVLMLAIMWIAPWAGQYVAGQMFAAGMVGSIGAATALGSVLGGVIGFGLNMLLNAVMPPPRPPTPQQAASLAAPSPTYNLQAQGNSARIDAAIPAGYGRMMIYPDFAAMPYAEYAGNEQYLYQLFCLGQGEYDIEAIRIEDTPISSFEEIEYEIVPPDGTMTLFPSNVVTSPEVSGQEAPGILTGATYSQTGTTEVTVSKTAHGFVVGRNVYLLVGSGDLPSAGYTVATAATDSFTVTAAASATTSGDTTIQTISGPFVASGPTTAATTVGIDIILPRALFYANASGGLDQVSVTFAVDLRKIDDVGAPLGSWYTAGTETITLATNTPQRFSYRYGVEAGRYEARLRRTDVKQTDSKYGNDLAWGGLRAYLPDDNDFGQVTLVAMRMRASNNLSSQASRKVNVIATRKLRTWNPSTGWGAPTATRSIAWAFADAAQNALYGGRLGDSQLDLAGLYALDQTWTTRDNYFDGRFDNALTLWEALTKIARAGRAKPFMQGGILYVARDQAQTLPVALYSMRNIVRGSFSVEYLMPTDDTADAVDVGYFDNLTWTPRRVPASLPDSLSTKRAKIDLFGVTERQHAYEEGLYEAATNRYRRRLIRFTAEMESFIPAFLDLIAIQHDMPQWGQHGEAVAWDGGTLTLTLSEPLTWGDGTHYIGLRAKNGSVLGPVAATPGADDYQVVLDAGDWADLQAAHPDWAPYTGSDYERTHVAFGWGETWRQPARVLSVTPRGLHHAEILCVNEDPSVHTADQGVTAPAVVTSQLPNLFTVPVILGLTVRSSTTDINTMLLSWQSAPGADHYLIEQSTGDGSWTRVGETSTAGAAVRALYGNATLVRVAGVGLSRGPWVTASYASGADYAWTGDADPAWTLDTDLAWSA
jgi:hypothetical protein